MEAIRSIDDERSVMLMSSHDVILCRVSSVVGRPVECIVLCCTVWRTTAQIEELLPKFAAQRTETAGKSQFK